MGYGSFVGKNNKSTYQNSLENARLVLWSFLKVHPTKREIRFRKTKWLYSIRKL